MPRHRRDQLLWILGAAASAVLFAQTRTRAQRAGGIDLTTYLEAARTIRRGDSPYAMPVAFPYIYPPFLAFALIPLSILPDDLALAIWFTLSAAAMLWALRETLLLAYPSLRDRSTTPFFFVLIASAYPIVQSNLRNAQVNFLVVALAVGALAAARTSSRGAAWGSAIGIKILPAALAPYFVRRGQWRLCALACVVLGALCVVPGLVLGARVIPITREYVVSFLGGGFGAAGPGALDFSAGGVLARVSGSNVNAIRLLGTSLCVAAVFAVDLRERPEPRGDARMFALYLAMIPLASPKSEVHHIAFALPAAAIAAGAVWYGFDRSRMLIALLTVAAVAYSCALAVSGSASVCWFLALVALASAVAVVHPR